MVLSGREEEKGRNGAHLSLLVSFAEGGKIPTSPP